MSDPNQPSVPAGWYPDGQGGERWWDGAQWTEHTRTPGGDGAAGAGGGAASGGAASGGAASGGGLPAGHDLPTQVAPVRGSAGPSGAGQPGAGQPGAGQPYGAPAAPQGGQPYGAPAGQPYGAPAGQPYGAPAGQAYGQPAGGFGQGFAQPPSGGGRGKGLIIALVAGVAAILVVCGVGGLLLLNGGGPGDVVEDYFTASIDDDYQAQCELRTKDSQEQLLEFADADDCDEFAEQSEKDLEDSKEEFEDTYDQSYDDAFGDLDFDFEVTKVEEDGDEAIVTYDASYEYSGDNDDFLEDYLDGDDSDSNTGWYRVEKEDGDWRVAEECFDKDCESGTGDFGE